jgi:plastocyanin
MAKQSLNIGTSANDNTGDTLRSGGDKINDNFDELYTALGNNTSLSISLANPATGQVLKYNGSSFVAANFNALTSALDVSGNSIISSSNGNITLAPHGTGDVLVTAGSQTATFDGATGNLDVGSTISYKNEYTALGNAPAAATYPGYFFTVDGDDNPYVNINITAGGVGDTRAKLLTEYSSIDDLSDVDITTNAPTSNQVLKWNGTTFVPGDDASGAGQQNIFASVAGDTGTTTANSAVDTLTIAGGTDIVTSVSGDTVTVAFNGTLTTTFAALTDTDVPSITQGDSLYWNGTDWVVTRSPMTWWDLGANQSNHFTFNGPGFSAPTDDPTLYVMRGMTYAFDNTANGANHPFRIQSTAGLSGTPYTTGQSGSGTSILYWTVPMNSPNTLYYQCTVHSLMNGTINVLN